MGNFKAYKKMILNNKNIDKNRLYTYNLTIICKNVVYYHHRILGGIIDDNSRFG